VFNIIARKTLLDYCRKYPEAAAALQEWYYELLHSNFKNFNDLKRVYGNASLIGDDRVIFNIMGNNFRLLVRVSFDYKAVQIKWFGTHAEYDRIDVKKIKFKKN
jgi:mRNA interferase HigB